MGESKKEERLDTGVCKESEDNEPSKAIANAEEKG